MSYEQQLQHEMDSDAQAAAQRLTELREAAAAGDVDTPRAQALIARVYADVEQNLKDTAAVQTRGMGGKYKGWLRSVGSDVAAVLAIRTCIELCGAGSRTSSRDGVTIQKLAGKIGKLYELEVLVREAEKVNPMYMDKIHAQIKDRDTKSQAHIRKVYSIAYDRVMKGELDSRLSESDTLHLGKFGVEACLQSGLIELIRTTGRSGTLVVYVLNPDIEAFLTEFDDADVNNIVSRSSGAMMCPPEPWTQLHGGGYLSDRRKLAFPLMSMRRIRKSERKRIREAFTAENMPKVFGTANYLQGVAYRIHKPTLDAIERVWLAGGGVLGVPRIERPVKPVFPFPDTWIKAEATPEELTTLAAWKRAATDFYNGLKEWRGHNREISGFLRQAKLHDGPVWFPVMCDTRGRWYYNGVPNPQGSDISKAVLHFERQKPLGADGFYWLRVCIANNAGFDKGTMDERAQWTVDNWPMFVNALDAPEDHPEVWGKDAPWCVYTAVYEMAQALASGDPLSYETGIPGHMDATCSGLQHFSAMLRDPEGAKYVNITPASPGAAKMDIYIRVAHAFALAQAEIDRESTDPKLAAIASWWLGVGVPRDLAKKPVMTYVYGATLRGTVDHIVEVMHKRGVAFPAGEIPEFEYQIYMAKALFSGIAQAVPAAAAAMQWLKSMCRLIPRSKRMEWKTPTGFLVQHDYQDYDEVRVKLRSCGVTDVIVREPTGDTVALGMTNAIAPNFVHALDASHLSLVALGMRELDLDMVAIHDSFGTHMCDVPKMQHIIRDTFRSMYLNNDVLGEFLWDVGIAGEDKPVRGNLDLNSVMHSEYFFS